jgi:hypothetical protein
VGKGSADLGFRGEVVLMISVCNFFLMKVCFARFNLWDGYSLWHFFTDGSGSLLGGCIAAQQVGERAYENSGANGNVVCLRSTSDGRFASAGRLQEFPVLFGYLPNLRYLRYGKVLNNKTLELGGGQGALVVV